MDTLIKGKIKRIFLETKYPNVNDIILKIYNLDNNQVVSENDKFNEVSNTGTYFFDLLLDDVGYFLLEIFSQTVSETSIKKVIKVVEKDIIDSIKTDAELSRKLQTNKAVVSEDNKLVTIYDDDRITILHSFDISDDKLSRTPK